MTKSKSVVFVGEYRFPNGDAAAVRTLSLARICRDCGYNVIVVGKGVVREEDLAADGNFYIEGIRYLTVLPANFSRWHRLLRVYSSIRQFPRAIYALNLPHLCAVVVNACDSARHVPFLISYCRRKNVPLIADVCEWYDPRHRRGGRANPFHAMFELMFHCYLPRVSNLIVVSSLLERHLRRPGVNICRIPAPVDAINVKYVPHRTSHPIILMYAGSPGRKDLIYEVVMAMYALDDSDKQNIELRLFGISSANLTENFDIHPAVIANLNSQLKVFGRVPHKTVLEAYSEAHFSVLFRKNQRFANAGFPSKVAESLAAGVPIIANPTSDLADYIKDGVAAVYAQGCTVEEICRALRRASRLSPEQVSTLRRGARETALRHFDYRTDLQRVKAFLGSIDT